MRASQLVTIFTSALILLTGAAVAQSSGRRRTRRMPTAAAAPASVHFTAAGDFGASAQTSAVLNGITRLRRRTSPRARRLLLRVDRHRSAWCDFVTARVGATYPFELITGNHESNGLDGNIDAFAACLPNQLPGLVGTYGKQWYVDVPATNPVARFVMISPGLKFPNGAWSYDEGTPRYAWAASAIDGASKPEFPGWSSGCTSRACP